MNPLKQVTQSKPTLVLDTSVIASVVLPDESHPIADAMVDAFQRFLPVVPGLWAYEFANALTMGVRRKRYSRESAMEAFTHANSLGMRVDTSAVSIMRLHDLAYSANITAYDAAYLELAQRLSGTLATLDKALMRAAQALHLPLFDVTKE